MKMKNSGVVLLTSIFLVLLISVLGIGYLALVNNQLEATASAIKSVKALYYAESGISAYIMSLRNATPPKLPPEGAYALSVIPVIPPSANITIESTGKVSGFRRIIQVTLDKSKSPIEKSDWHEI